MHLIRYSACIGITSSVVSVMACAYYVALIRDRMHAITLELREDMVDFNVLADEALLSIRHAKSNLLSVDAASVILFKNETHYIAKRQASFTSCQCQKSTECPAGPKGPPGRPGDDGDDGLTGENGSLGLPGSLPPAPYSWYTPQPCRRCPPGELGLPGTSGFPGKQGTKGPRGPTGKPGGDGFLGPPGLGGLPGDQGLSGNRGPKGTSGAVGTFGGKGEVGRPGSVGPAGVPGRSGNPGSDGFDGDNSYPGDIGLRGEPGIPGKDGRVGPTGSPGAPGKDIGYCQTCPNPDTAKIGSSNAGANSNLTIFPVNYIFGKTVSRIRPVNPTLLPKQKGTAKSSGIAPTTPKPITSTRATGVAKNYPNSRSTQPKNTQQRSVHAPPPISNASRRSTSTVGAQPAQHPVTKSGYQTSINPNQRRAPGATITFSPTTTTARTSRVDGTSTIRFRGFLALVQENWRDAP